MTLKQIFGRTIAYVPLEGLMRNDDTVAEFFPCEGQEFDIIFYDPEYEKLEQAMIHEELHAVICRTGIAQTEISDDTIEVLCENIATYFVETYSIKPKV